MSKGALRPAHLPQGGSAMRNSLKRFVLLRIDSNEGYYWTMVLSGLLG